MKLPAPKKDGGPAVLQAIENRASARGDSFPTGAVSQEALSTLLWAASGRNRAGNGWTVPTAMAHDPYVAVYVAGADGVSLYEGQTHTLSKVSEEDVRGSIGMQGFVGSAPYVLVFVVKDGNKFGEVLVGAMTQNIYLASQAENVGVRYVASLKPEVVRKAFNLVGSDVPLALMPIGGR